MISAHLKDALEGAASFLEGTAASRAGVNLLERLGYPAREHSADRADFAKLLRFAARLERIFELRPPDAPGLAAFGAEVDVAKFSAADRGVFGASGVGLTKIAALRACLAEAAEIVGQYRGSPSTEIAALPRGVPDAGVVAAIAELADWSASDGEIDLVEAVEAKTAARIGFPATLCFRDGALAGPTPLYVLGIGCAAGLAFSAAEEHGVLEWIERDAVALWWRGGRRGRPVAVERMAASKVSEVLSASRREVSDRRTWFLDISTELAIPVVAALSVGSDGTGFAYGFAARPTYEDALVASFLELCQIELADRVVTAKLKERGAEGLNPVDRMHLERTSTVSADWPILHPSGRPAGLADTQASDVAAALLEAGHRLFTIDLTRRDVAIAVCRTFVSGLQPDPGDVVTARLDATSRNAKPVIHNHPKLRIV